MWQKTDTLTVKSIGLCFYGREQLRARRCALSRGATRSEKSTPTAFSEDFNPSIPSLSRYVRAPQRTPRGEGRS